LYFLGPSVHFQLKKLEYFVTNDRQMLYFGSSSSLDKCETCQIYVNLLYKAQLINLSCKRSDLINRSSEITQHHSLSPDLENSCLTGKNFLSCITII